MLPSPRSKRKTPRSFSLEVRLFPQSAKKCRDYFALTSQIDFAEGEALTLTEVATLLKAARQAPNVPPAPDNKYALSWLSSIIVVDFGL